MDNENDPVLIRELQEECGLLAGSTKYAPVLMTRAYQAMENSFSPWSKTRVGVAVVTRKGCVFSGCNIEVRSNSGSLCAEQSAFAAACTAGDHDVIEIFIIKSDRFGVLPCGSCRQMIDHLSPEAIILAKVSEIQGYKRIPIKDLLPDISHFSDTGT